MNNNNNNFCTYNNTSEYSLRENLKHIEQACQDAIRFQRLRRLQRKHLFRGLVRRVIGGLPVKKYVLTLKITYVYDFDPMGERIQHSTYEYVSKTDQVQQNHIDDAVEEFLSSVSANASWENSFDGGQATMESYEQVSHRLLPTDKLESLPLLAFHSLADKCCPDDAIIQATPGQCVIDGLLSMLNFERYKTLTAAKLIRQIGSKTPSVNQIKSWY